MSALVLFGKQLLITASCPGTKTHFRSSHSKVNEHHSPHLPQQNTLPTPNSNQGKGMPQHGLTTSTPAWGSVLLPAGCSPTLLPPRSTPQQTLIQHSQQPC